MVELLSLCRQPCRLADPRCLTANSAIWTHGPEWLTHEEQRPVWIPKEMLHVQLAVAKAEILPESVEQPVEDHSGVEMIINIDRYSTLTKLLYVTVYVLRFIEYVKLCESKTTGPITVNELSMAQTLWIRNCQLSAFSKEINNLKNSPASNRRLPLVRQLRLFLDSCNLLRCGGRIHNAPPSSHTKFLCLLPAGHRLTTLTVYATHVIQLHGGVHSTVTALRQCYWIPAAR